jgi:hypothetical protein
MILGVEVHERRGVKSQEYLDIPRFYASSRMGCIDVHNDVLFLIGPLEVSILFGLLGIGHFDRVFVRILGQI